MFLLLALLWCRIVGHKWVRDRLVLGGVAYDFCWRCGKQQEV